MSKGNKMITELIDSVGKIITDREKIIKETTKENLYDETETKTKNEYNKLQKDTLKPKQDENSTEYTPRIGTK